MLTDYSQGQESPAHNRRLAQWRVTWLIEHSTSHQLLWCIDSFVLRNPPLRQAPKRCLLYNSTNHLIAGDNIFVDIPQSLE